MILPAWLFFFTRGCCAADLFTLVLVSDSRRVSGRNFPAAFGESERGTFARFRRVRAAVVTEGDFVFVVVQRGCRRGEETAQAVFRFPVFIGLHRWSHPFALCVGMLCSVCPFFFAVYIRRWCAHVPLGGVHGVCCSRVSSYLQVGFGSLSIRVSFITCTDVTRLRFSINSYPGTVCVEWKQRCLVLSRSRKILRTARHVLIYVTLDLPVEYLGVYACMYRVDKTPNSSLADSPRARPSFYCRSSSPYRT